MVETVSLEDARREFWDAWNGLSEVHTQEDLEAQSEKMWSAREVLLKVDPDFRAMLKGREDKKEEEAKKRRDQTQLKREQIMSKVEAEVSAAMMMTRAVRGMPQGDLDEWVQKHKFKALTPEEVKTKIKLVCPICGGPERNNIINGEPGCIQCMHFLVAESELKNYNRAYRRRWKRKRAR